MGAGVSFSTGLLSVVQHLSDTAKWLLRWDHSWHHIAPSALHSEGIPGLLVASSSGLKGFQGFLLAPGSVEYFVVASNEIQPSLLLFHLFLMDRTLPCPVRITLVTALTWDLLFWEVQLLLLDFS